MLYNQDEYGLIAPWENDERVRDFCRNYISRHSAFGSLITLSELWTENVIALSEAYPSEDTQFKYDKHKACMKLAQYMVFVVGIHNERILKYMKQSALYCPDWDKGKYLEQVVNMAKKYQLILNQSFGQPIDFLPDHINDSPLLQSKNRPRLLPAFELFDAGQSKIQWLVEDYIQRNSMMLLFGEPASAKSFTAIDIACCVATGKPWHGHNVRHGGVFYIAGEGYNGLKKRLRAWEKINDQSISSSPIFISDKAIDITDPKSLHTLNELIKEMYEYTRFDPVLIIIDTLARNFGDGDENSTQDMNAFIQNLDALKNEWNATILIVHHTGHSDKKRARGSIALKAAMDHE